MGINDITAFTAPIAPHVKRAVPHCQQGKMTTILFCDLVESTKFVCSVLLDDQREFFLNYYKAVNEQVASSGGEVIQIMGDGIQATFEDNSDYNSAACNAIQTALKITTTLRDFFYTEEHDLNIRISIATGVIIYNDTHHEIPVNHHLMFGKAPYLAARLNTIAHPGSVVVCDRTRFLTLDSFDFLNAGRRMLKGFDSLMQCWAVYSKGSQPKSLRQLAS